MTKTKKTPQVARKGSVEMRVVAPFPDSDLWQLHLATKTWTDCNGRGGVINDGTIRVITKKQARYLVNRGSAVTTDKAFKVLREADQQREEA